MKIVYRKPILLYNNEQEEKMNKLGYLVLNIAVALYLFANGIFGISEKPGVITGKLNSEFGKMIQTIFGKGDFANVLLIVMSVCAIAAAVFLLLQLFRVQIGVTDLILFVFVIVWAAFIVIVDIIAPMQDKDKVKFLPYIVQLSSHLMVLGALISSTKRISN
jgi:hypothetical protein